MRLRWASLGVLRVDLRTCVRVDQREPLGLVRAALAPATWFGALAEVRQLGRVGLADALELTLLTLDRQPERSEAAAVRWIGPFILERRVRSIATAARLVAAFECATRPAGGPPS